MIKKIVLLLVGSIVGSLASPLQAAEVPSTQIGKFKCLSKQQLPSFEINRNSVHVGSFSMSERKSALHGDESRIEVSFAVANRREKDIFVVGQFILVANDGITAAITAAPEFQRVRSGTTDVAKGSIFVTPGTLDTITGVCINF